jgi:hypothetical protein
VGVAGATVLNFSTNVVFDSRTSQEAALRTGRGGWSGLFVVGIALALAGPASAQEAQKPAVDDDPVPPDALSEPAQEPAPAPKPPSRGSIKEEVTLDKADSTEENPRAGAFSNHLAGSFNVGEKWAVDLNFDYTATEGTPAPPGQIFSSPGGKSTAFGLGLDWDPSDHLSFGALVSASPRSTTISATTLDYVGALGKTTTLDAQIHSEASSVSGGFTASYDTAGDSDLELAFTAGATANHLDSTQVITNVELRNGQAITKAALVNYCKNFPTVCPKALRAALKEQDYPLDSLQLSLGTVATIFGDTDVGVTGDVWLYDQDPTQAGYFSLTQGKAGVSGGGGVPIAPMREDVRLDLTHRFGDLSVKLNGALGGYVSGTGGGTYGGGLKVQYKFTRSFRMWVTLSARHDVDDQGNDSVSRSGSLGAAFRF